MFPEYLLDQLFLTLLFHRLLVALSPSVSVVGCSTYTQYGAKRFYIKFMSQYLDQVIMPRQVARLKMLKAFFKISRSVSN